MLYVSSASALLDQSELEELLARARLRNAEQGITGLLLYQSGNFLQYFEGGDPAVSALWEKLLGDRRHRDVYRLCDLSIDRRLFPRWEMAWFTVRGGSQVRHLLPRIEAGAATEGPDLRFILEYIEHFVETN